MKIYRKAVTAAVLGAFILSGIAQASDYAGLKAAIDNAASNPTFIYTLDSDITGISTTLGIMQGSGYELTIDGSSNNYSIGANGVKGISVQAGQKLIVQNVGSFTKTETGGDVTGITVNGSWNGFVSDRQGGIVSEGILEVTNSVFVNNEATWGAAISNKGDNMKVSGSAFVENIATVTSNNDDGGAAIFNNKNIDYIEDSVFAKNTGRHGGAVYNKQGATITKITGTSFLENNTTSSTGAGVGGGALFNNGTIGELSDSYFAGNATAKVGGALYNAGTITIKNTDFVNNSASVGGTAAEGGAIYNTSAGTISSIDGGVFDGNSSDSNGGAIANYGTIESITADFENNKTKALGAAIYNKGTINTIKNSNFKNNSTSNSSSDGGGIYNDKNAVIEKIVGGIFEENKATNEGSAISNYGKINLIEGVEFKNNETTSTKWGIIYNNGVGTIGTIKGITMTDSKGDGINSNGIINDITDSTITGSTGHGIAIDKQAHIDLVDNTIISNNAGGGIAIKNVVPQIDVIKNCTIVENSYGIKTGSDLTILSDGGNTTIKGNTSTDGKNLGIYVGHIKDSETGESTALSTPTLTLKQVNNGNTYIHDVIEGNNGYSVDIVGDNTGTLYLYNNIDNGKVNVTTANIDTADGTLYDYTLKSLNTDSEASNWKIDVDLFGKAADTIATTTLSQTSVKYVHLKELNLIGGDLDDLVDGESVTVQVLKTQTNLQLSLDSDLSGEQKLASVNIDPEHTRVDEMKVTTEWGDIYHEWLVDDKFRNTYGEWTLDQTTTANDSLTVVISKKIEGGDEHDQGAAGDTLRLVNEDTTIDSRNFNAADSGSTYTVNEDLGGTKGTLTINGIEDDATETIDLNGKSGFVLGDDAVALNLNDVTVTGSDTLISVTNGDAELNIKNVVLDGKVSGTEEFDMTTAGTSEFKDAVTNANITNTGTLTTTAENVSGSTVTNESILKLSGALDKEIYGDGTTKVNSTLTLDDGAKIDGTLDMNSGAVTVSAGSITEHTIGAMTGNGTMAIDLKLGDESADTLTLSNSSSGTITLTSVNILDPTVTEIDKTFSALVLDANDDSTITLALSDAVASAFDSKEYVIERINAKTTYDTIEAETSWDHVYEKHITAEGTVYGKLNLSDDARSIIVKKSRQEGGGTTDESMGDTLKLVNQDDTNDEKEFNATVSGSTYTVTEDLGETQGTLTINGIEDSATETIDLAGKSGFVLGDDAVALNLNDVTVTGSDTLVSVTNGDADLNITNVVLDGKVSGTEEFDMTTAGVSEFKDAVTNANITNTGTLTTTAENVSGSTVTNESILKLSGALDKEIKGDGTTEVNQTLTLNDGAKIVGTLDMNDGAVTVSAGSITEHTIGAMTGDGTMAIDLKLGDEDADTLTLSNTSNGTITLSSVNILDPTVTEIDKTFSALVLDANSDSTITLALSDAVASAFDSKEYTIEVVPEKTTVDTIEAETSWDHVYEKHITSEKTVYGKLGLSDDARSIIVSESSHTGGDTTDVSLGDTLKVVNQDDTNTDKTFKASSVSDVYTLTDDAGTTSGNLTIQGVASGEGDNRTTSVIDFDGHNGVNLANDNSSVTFKDVTIKNAAVIATSDNGSTVVNLDGAVLDGSNGDGIFTSSTVNITGASDIGDDITLVYDQASINFNDTDSAKVSSTLTGIGTLNINKSTVTFEDSAKTDLDTTLNNSTLILKNEGSITGVNTTINGSNTLNIMNDKVGAVSLGEVNLNGTLKMMVDADLANKKMDTLSALSAQIGRGAKIDVAKINLLSPTTAKKLSILFTDNEDLAKVVKYSGEGEIVYSPIFKYKTSYEIKNDMGYFTFGRSSKPDYNPAVLASPVMAQAGMMANMNATMNYAFEHLDGFTKVRAKDRFAVMNANKYAIASTDFNENLNLNEIYENKGAWVIPYASFENVHLKNGPRVDVNSYGTFTGFDTDFKQLSHGWNTVFTGYLGYNGSHISYKGITTLTNGGMMGATQTWYKGNFWTALTATAGASVADTNTMYGHEDYASLLAGIGSKTGYNFEFAEGKFIVQPIWFMNYSFIKTFDYTNAAGVRIDSDPLHTIQLNPSIRFIGNFKRGWQPYASVGMVWNLMNDTHVFASTVKLPEMSVKPYVEYGAGVQKSFGERFTGYIQAMLRNGGRNGIALSGGFRWELGRTGGSSQKVMYKSRRVVRSNYQNTTAPQKKVLKSLSQTQKMALQNR